MKKSFLKFILLLAFGLMSVGCAPLYGPKEITMTHVFPEKKPDDKADETGVTFEILKDEQLKKTFADVAGLERPKMELRNIIDYLTRPEWFTRLGAQPPSGVIFYGAPGTGKTEIARALAGEVKKHRENLSFIVASGAVFSQKYVGEGARLVRELFDLARKNKPAIIFIDEFDAVAAIRTPESKSIDTVNQLLTELDGFSEEENSDIFVIAATNRIDNIDPAVLRPGRMDERIEIGLPDGEARAAVIRHYLNKEPAITGINVDHIVNQTNQWSAADLKALVNKARIHATINDKQAVTPEDFDYVIENWR